MNQKKNSEIIKRKCDKLFVIWKCCNSSFKCCIDKKNVDN